jgi:hypothetical protein
MIGLPVGGLFRVTGGLWEAELCIVTLVLSWRVPRSTAVDLMRFWLGVGIFEALQMVSCRLWIWDISTVPKEANLCEAVTGLPIVPVTYTLYLVTTIWIVRKELRAALRWLRK